MAHPDPSYHIKVVLPLPLLGGQASASENALEKTLTLEGDIRLTTLASGCPSAIEELCAPGEAG